ncbi:MAG TPA: SDR family oxidoreductase [Candidatus Acidoferrales bacterium]|nr:SDR family oxidoreductase [Candidatus Acidoferrales bacterium]
MPFLRARSHEVSGLDSELFSRCNFGEPPQAVPTVRKDVRDVVTADFRGIDAVVHLAGLSNDPLGDLDPERTYEINYRASVLVAEQAKRAGVQRFVFSSSCSTYGAAGDDILDESAGFNPVTPYGESKVMAERDIAALADDDFTPVFLRNATAFGVSPRLRFDLVVNNLVAWASASGFIRFKSDGSAWRPLVHIEDISRAVAAVLEAPRERVHCEAFNIGKNGENYRIRDLAEIIAEVATGTEVSFAQGASADLRNYRVDCSKYEQTFPEMPLVWDVPRGVRELYAALQKHPVSAEEFEGIQYCRIAHLRWLIDEGLVDGALRVTSEVAA